MPNDSFKGYLTEWERLLATSMSERRSVRLPGKEAPALQAITTKGSGL